MLRTLLSYVILATIPRRKHGDEEKVRLRTDNAACIYCTVTVKRVTIPSTAIPAEEID